MKKGDSPVGVACKAERVCPCRFQQAELVHSRTAMVGVAGILIPDVRSADPMPCVPCAALIMVSCMCKRAIWQASQRARARSFVHMWRRCPCRPLG